MLAAQALISLMLLAAVYLGLWQRLSELLPRSLALAVALLLPNVAMIVLVETLGAVHQLRVVTLRFSLWALLLASALLTLVRRTSVAMRTRLGATEVLTAAVLGLVFVTGVSTAPNNIDSLSYHLPKMKQWFQNGDLAPFVTPYPAQVYLAPGGEQVLASWHALFGTDHVLFVPQWISLVVVAICARFAVTTLGAPSWAGGVSALALVSAPPVLGEAATTQNDLLATAYVAIVVVACLAPRAVPTRAQRTLTLLAPVMASAAVATKPPVALFALPFAIWLAIDVLRGPKRFAAGVVAAAVVALVCLNVGWMARNVGEYGNPTGPDLGITVAAAPLQAAASNGVKNVGTLWLFRRQRLPTSPSPMRSVVRPSCCPVPLDRTRGSTSPCPTKSTPSETRTAPARPCRRSLALSPVRFCWSSVGREPGSS